MITSTLRLYGQGVKVQNLSVNPLQPEAQERVREKRKSKTPPILFLICLADCFAWLLTRGIFTSSSIITCSNSFKRHSDLPLTESDNGLFPGVLQGDSKRARTT